MRASAALAKNATFRGTTASSYPSQLQTRGSAILHCKSKGESVVKIVGYAPLTFSKYNARWEQRQLLLEREAVLNPDNFVNARWHDLYVFFAAGHPPLYWQLLALNTLFLTAIVVRKARAKFHMRKSTAYFIQATLIFSNCIVMFQKETVDAALSVRHLI
jgi:hypothetical protein